MSDLITTPSINYSEKSLCPEETFDVVDFRDEVVRQETRSDVHRLGLLHRAIHVFVFNSAGQLYLQRRSMLKDSAPGKWVSSCSGHVDAGETYDAAAVRELSEEIGLRGVELELLFKADPCEQTGREFVQVYRGESDGPFTLDPSEISEGKWVNMDELADWLEQSPRDFAWSFVHLWGLYCSR